MTLRIDVVSHAHAVTFKLPCECANLQTTKCTTTGIRIILQWNVDQWTNWAFDTFIYTLHIWRYIHQYINDIQRYRLRIISYFSYCRFQYIFMCTYACAVPVSISNTVATLHVAQVIFANVGQYLNSKSIQSILVTRKILDHKDRTILI